MDTERHNDKGPGMRLSARGALRAAMVAVVAAAAVAGFAARSQVSVEVVEPISISVLESLRFGAFVPSVSNVGAVRINSPDGSRQSLNVALMPSEFGAALFQVTGERGAAFLIALPGRIDITGPVGFMAVGFFESVPVGTGTINAFGFRNLSVGAVVRVGINQPGGNYTGTFDVTVQYQ